MPAARIRIRSSELGSLIVGLKRRIRTVEYKKALRQALPKLRRLSVSVFASESDPDGQPWPKLALSTLIEKKRLGHGRKKILVRSGRLRKSLTRVSHPDTIAKFRTFQGITSLFWGTNVPYSLYHQSDEPRSRLPRRRFLPEDTDELYEMIVDPVFDEIIASISERWI